ncbi:MAG: hypothetical protein JST82_09210 [Bacteroidetes bacterium]|nr:hypothetical protein [Bacteroidota bacterium]
MKNINKILLLLLTVCFANNSFAAAGDTSIIFYDYWWKKCDKDIAHYYRVKYKDGDMWHTQDFYFAENSMQKEVTYSDDSLTIQQGMVYSYHPNGKLKQKARYIDGKMEGIVKGYDTLGRLIDSGLYKKGIPYKAHFKWDAKGNVIFKGLYDAEGYGVGQEWQYFPDGKISSYGITSVEAKRDSIWTYYYNTGVMSCQDFYDHGQRMGRICYNDKGEKYDANCDDLPARPVDKEETISNRFGQRYSDIKEGNIGDQFFTFKKGAYTVLKVSVDEKGKMTNVEIMHKIHPKVDKLIIDIYTGITKFKPATDGNRPISASFEQYFPLFGL